MERDAVPAPKISNQSLKSRQLMHDLPHGRLKVQMPSESQVTLDDCTGLSLCHEFALFHRRADVPSCAVDCRPGAHVLASCL